MKKFIVLAALAALAFSPAFEAEAASKKKTPSRSDYTKEQQKKFLSLYKRLKVKVSSKEPIDFADSVHLQLHNRRLEF